MSLKEALRNVLKQQDPWLGTPQELWDQVRVGGNAVALGRLLALKRTELLAGGITVEPNRTNGRRLVRVGSESLAVTGEVSTRHSSDRSVPGAVTGESATRHSSDGSVPGPVTGERPTRHSSDGSVPGEEPTRHPSDGSVTGDTYGNLLRLRDCGLNLIPLPRGEKKPKKSWLRYQTQRNSTEELQTWSRDSVNAAIVTGEISKVVVVDCDSPEALAWAEANLPATLVRTLTGEKDGWRGQHWFYRHPGKPVANQARITTGQGKLALDIRGDGGYVLAPGSLHPSGVLYEAVGTWSADGFAALPPFPTQWLQQRPPESRPATWGPPLEHLPNDLRRRIFAYLDSVPGAPDGSRNNTACELTRKIWDKIADHEVGWEALQRWNDKNTPPLEERELRQTYQSALKRPQNPGGDWLKEPARPQPATTKTQKPSKGVPNPTSETWEDHYSWTDSGNGERLVAERGKNSRYIADRPDWFLWDGARWNEDKLGSIVSWTKTMFHRLFKEAKNARKDATESEDEELKRTAAERERWFRSCLSCAKINCAIESAKTEPGIPMLQEGLDQHPFLLTVLNGTLELRTGHLREHRREDHISKLAPVEFNPTATCPHWTQFLLTSMAGDQEMVDYLQRVAGLCLTGDTSDEAFFFLHGQGCNGKSTFLHILKCLLGDYAKSASFESFVQDGARNANRSDLARLVGARLVTASESEENQNLAAALIKTLSGAERFTAAFKFKDEFEFDPTHKLFLASNHKPTIRDNSIGIWRRLHLIPFTVQIKGEDVDKTLKSKLHRELSGILNWAIKGCLQWQKIGLKPPAKVRDAVRQYQSDMDQLGRFLNDCCVTGHYGAYETPAADLFKAYEEWCTESGEKPWNQTTFGKALGSRQLERVRTKRCWVWKGIGLRSEIPDPGDKIQQDLGLDTDLIPG